MMAATTTRVAVALISSVAAVSALGPGPAPRAAAADLPPGVRAVEVRLAKRLFKAGGHDRIRAGDFVEYESEPVPGLRTVTRREVVEVGNHTYTELHTADVDGQRTHSAVRYVFSEPDPQIEEVRRGGAGPGGGAGRPADGAGGAAGSAVRPPVVKIGVGGRELECEARDTAGPGNTVTRTWVSRQVPLGGVVRIERDGKAVLTLRDFGRGG
jgi:hypothetical protein